MNGLVEDQEGRANGVAHGTGSGRVRANSALSRGPLIRSKMGLRDLGSLRVLVIKVSDEKTNIFY